LILLPPSARGQAASGAEVERVREQMAEQQKALQALQATLAEQQKKLDALTAAPAVSAPAVSAPAVSAPKVEVAKAIPAPLKWYDKYTVRGYVQVRDNRVYNSNKNLTCPQCDPAMGDHTNFSLRRARLVLTGDVNDRINFFLQAEFAQTVGGALHVGQIRDIYADVSLDKKREYRLRVGQSKVPFGWENMQSSQNRLALDRSDPINSSAPGEREVGVFLYYAPTKIRTRLAALAAAGTGGLKGSGDYGIVALGVYNGQSVNRPEANNNVHTVARVAYPWQLKNGQVIEAGLQAYTGRFTVDTRTAGVKGPADFTFKDRRVAGTFVVFPKPFGFQSEFVTGSGPSYSPRSNTIVNRNVRGGYAQPMYLMKFKGQVFTPFYRFQYYSGGKKQELDARSYLVRDHDIGIEWQQSNFFEITGEFTHSDRTYEDAGKPNNRQKGNILRVQFQVNY
jgi:phosphate-selective porin